MLTKTRPPQGAQAALRAVRLLKLFTNEQPEMSLAEISKASGLNKTTTHRLLRALDSESLIARNSATSAYCLGPGLMALGGAGSREQRRRVRPLLRTLARESGETAVLEVPIDDCMLILDEVAGSHLVSASTGNIGTRWPMHATSSGKAWMAFEESGLDRIGEDLKPMATKTLTRKALLLPQVEDIRRLGYAVTVDELEDGFAAVATVFRGALGDIQGTISLGGPTTRMGTERRAELGNALCRAAARLAPEF